LLARISDVSCESSPLLRESSVSLSVYAYLLDNSPTHQLAVSQVADWSTHGQVWFFKSRKDLYTKEKPNINSNPIDCCRCL